jgi:hypothetical protein
LSVSHQNQIDSEALQQPIQVNVPDEDEELKQ